MVGRWAFPFGAQLIFRCENVSFWGCTQLTNFPNRFWKLIEGDHSHILFKAGEESYFEYVIDLRITDRHVYHCAKLWHILIDDNIDRYIRIYTIPETNSSHLNMDGWNTSFLLGWPIFRGYVTFREGRLWYELKHMHPSQAWSGWYSSVLEKSKVDPLCNSSCFLDTTKPQEGNIVDGSGMFRYPANQWICWIHVNIIDFYTPQLVSTGNSEPSTPIFPRFWTLVSFSPT